MAKPLVYVPQPVPVDTAGDEVQRLVETLHEHGVLRLLTNLVAESHGVAKVALDQLETPKGKNLVDNLSVLVNTLTQIEDGALDKLLTGVSKGVNAAAQGLDDKAPGTFGLLRELNDPDVRRGLNAVLTLLATVGRHFKEA